MLDCITRFYQASDMSLLALSESKGALSRVCDPQVGCHLVHQVLVVRRHSRLDPLAWSSIVVSGVPDAFSQLPVCRRYQRACHEVGR